jgi:hypothetical protein
LIKSNKANTITTLQYLNLCGGKCRSHADGFLFTLFVELIMLSKTKLRALFAEEKAASKEYAKLGLKAFAKDEALILGFLTCF